MVQHGQPKPLGNEKLNTRLRFTVTLEQFEKLKQTRRAHETTFTYVFVSESLAKLLFTSPLASRFVKPVTTVPPKSLVEKCTILVETPPSAIACLLTRLLILSH